MGRPVLVRWHLGSQSNRGSAQVEWKQARRCVAKVTPFTMYICDDGYVGGMHGGLAASFRFCGEVMDTEL